MTLRELTTVSALCCYEFALSFASDLPPCPSFMKQTSITDSSEERSAAMTRDNKDKVGVNVLYSSLFHTFNFEHQG